MKCGVALCFQLAFTWLLLLLVVAAPVPNAATPDLDPGSPQRCEVGSSFVQRASRAFRSSVEPPPLVTEWTWPDVAGQLDFELDDQIRQAKTRAATEYAPGAATLDMSLLQQEEAWSGIEIRSPKTTAAAEYAQRAETPDVSLFPQEELGFAEPVVSMLEVPLEQNADVLSGPGGEGEWAQCWLFYSMAILFVAMLLMAVPFVGLGTDVNCCAHFVGMSIKSGVQKFDRSVLGVDVEIGKLTVNPFDGYIDCSDLIIHNPPGYTSPYLLKASKVLLDIDMVQYVQSRTQKVLVQNLVFKDISGIYEKKWETSNMQEVLQHLDAYQDIPEDDEVVEQVLSQAEYEIRRVEVHNVGVNVRLSGAIGEYINMDLEAGDVYYKDFMAEVGHFYLDDVARTLLKSLLKTVITNVAGKHAG